MSFSRSSSDAIFPIQLPRSFKISKYSVFLSYQNIPNNGNDAIVRPSAALKRYSRCESPVLATSFLIFFCSASLTQKDIFLSLTRPPESDFSFVFSIIVPLFLRHKLINFLFESFFAFFLFQRKKVKVCRIFCRLRRRDRGRCKRDRSTFRRELR